MPGLAKGGDHPLGDGLIALVAHNVLRHLEVFYSCTNEKSNLFIVNCYSGIMRVEMEVEVIELNIRIRADLNLEIFERSDWPT